MKSRPALAGFQIHKHTVSRCRTEAQCLAAGLRRFDVLNRRYRSPRSTTLPRFLVLLLCCPPSCAGPNAVGEERRECRSGLKKTCARDAKNNAKTSRHLALSSNTFLFVAHVRTSLCFSQVAAAGPSRYKASTHRVACGTGKSAVGARIESLSSTWARRVHVDAARVKRVTAHGRGIDDVFQSVGREFLH